MNRFSLRSIVKFIEHTFIPSILLDPQKLPLLFVISPILAKRKLRLLQGKSDLSKVVVFSKW